MNLLEIKEKVNSEEYSFLRENEHLNENVCLLTLGGSHAYGTNVETSDLDVRGIALNKPQELLGLSNFDHFLNTKTDTTIYSFNNIVKLLLNVNPNVIEMLGTKEEHQLYISKEGQMLRDNIDLFLTQKASHSFGGYANQQLRRLQNALARDKYEQSEKEQHTLNTILNQLNHYEEKYFNGFELSLYLGDSFREDYDKEIMIDLNLKNYPLRDMCNISSEMANVVKDYGKLNHRNSKKDDLHLNKHFMHLVRLYLMATEILSGKGVNTYRENDRELLLSIRNGCYQMENGLYRPEAFELIDSLEKEMKYAKEHTELPKQPDFKKIEEFVMEVNSNSLSKEKRKDFLLYV